MKYNNKFNNKRHTLYCDSCVLFEQASWVCSVVEWRVSWVELQGDSGGGSGGGGSVPLRVRSRRSTVRGARCGATTRTCFTQFVRESYYLRHCDRISTTRELMLIRLAKVKHYKNRQWSVFAPKYPSYKYQIKINATQPCIARKRVTSEWPAGAIICCTRMQWWNVVCCCADMQWCIVYGYLVR